MIYSEYYQIIIFIIFSDTFMVEDAVEAIGFGTFQWKLSILTGLSWVRIVQTPCKLDRSCSCPLPR